MINDTYNPERDITPEFLASVDNWIEQNKEVFVVMRYLRAAGAKDYALITNSNDFRKLIDICPEGTDIIVFRDPQLPLRGVVDTNFIENAKALIPDGDEYLYIRTEPEQDIRCFGEMGDLHISLDEDLGEEVGGSVAIGVCPSFIADDNEAMISASKGGIDGPR